MWEVRRYTAEDKFLWNNFLAEAKNATFLFHRDFMDYHQERFQDFSLLFWHKNQLKALLPAHLKGAMLCSHQGLSYGGIILAKTLRLQEILQLFETLVDFCKLNAIQEIYYKALPQIYQTAFSFEEQLFFLQQKAQLIQIDYNAVIDLKQPFVLQKRRIRAFQKAIKANLRFEQTTDFTFFWEKILAPKLKEKYQTLPTHSLAEIRQLAERFPENILQYLAWHKTEGVAGLTIFKNFPVMHVQYSAATEEGLQTGALDFLLQNLMHTHRTTFQYLSLGISNVEERLNEDLWAWKEGFGAKLLPHYHWKIFL